MHDPEGPPETYFEREPVGAFYRLDGDCSIHRMIEGILVSNGLCWSPDGTRMYASDSPTRTIRTWRYDLEAGDISDEQVFATIPDEPGRGTPDGAIVDAEGGLWTAEFQGSRITRFDPDGTEDRMIELPVSRPTCPMFGGRDLRTLYVTSKRSCCHPMNWSASRWRVRYLYWMQGLQGYQRVHFPDEPRGYALRFSIALIRPCQRSLGSVS
jgi:sugar lactone lactonase YvrE